MCSLSYTPLPEITLLRDKVEDRETTDFWCLLASHMTKVSTNHRFKLISADQDVEAEVRGPFFSSRVVFLSPLYPVFLFVINLISLKNV